MLEPEGLNRHAERLLLDRPDLVAVRRAISAMYYALFHELSGKAASRLVGEENPSLRAMLRRSAEHRDFRDVCDALAKAPSGVPPRFAEVLRPPVSDQLRLLAATFALLQDARHAADYDLERQPSLSQAEAYLVHVEGGLPKRFESIEHDPNTRAFLALLLVDRKRRRS